MGIYNTKNNNNGKQDSRKKENEYIIHSPPYFSHKFEVSPASYVNRLYNEKCLLCFESKNNNSVFLLYKSNDVIIAYNLSYKELLFKARINYAINNIKYYYSISNRLEYILIAINKENKIRIYNFNDFSFMFNINLVNNSFSSIKFVEFIDYKNNTLLIIFDEFNINYFYDDIKSCDFNKKKLSLLYKIFNSETINYMSSYSNLEYHNFFIFFSYKSKIKLYDYEKKKIFAEYFDKGNSIVMEVTDVAVSNNRQERKLLVGFNNGIIEIYGLVSAKLLKIITICNKGINSFNIWNEEYCFVGIQDSKIGILNIFNESIITYIRGLNNGTEAIKKNI